MGNEMGKFVAPSAREVADAFLDVVLGDKPDAPVEGVSKVVTVLLCKSFVFEGDFLAEYLEQLGDYEDTPSQREWFVLDYLFDSDKVAWLKRNTDLKVIGN